ncbi:MAG: hypothetical protein JSW15_12085, partial [Deltaproteobacteria bacterium]
SCRVFRRRRIMLDFGAVPTTTGQMVDGLKRDPHVPEHPLPLTPVYTPLKGEGRVGVDSEDSAVVHQSKKQRACIPLK